MSKKTKTIDELLTEVVQFNDSIPSNWLVVTADTIIDVRDGTHDTPKYIEEGFPLITSKNLKNGKLDFSDVKYISPEDHELICKRSRVDEQDILFAMIGTIGNPVLVEDIQNEFSIKNVGLFKPNRKIIDSKYLYYYLSSPIYLEPLIGNAKGSTQKFVSLGMLRKSPIILPPINEQKRIAEKIERLFAKIDEAKRLIEEVKESFELRKISIIKRIIDEGKEDAQQRGWKFDAIKDIFEIKGGGTPSKSNESYWNGTIPWVTPKDMKTLYIQETKDYITEEGLNNSSAKMVTKGSIAMVVRSGILQHSLPVAYLMTDGTVNQDLKVFNSGDELVNKYFLWYVKANEKYLLNEYSKAGTTVNSIEFEKFKSHIIPIPPREEIEKKITKIESIINKEHDINMYVDQISQLENLKHAILHKAFRGELGTNDPTDEHAIELLKEVLKSK